MRRMGCCDSSIDSGAHHVLFCCETTAEYPTAWLGNRGRKMAVIRCIIDPDLPAFGAECCKMTGQVIVFIDCSSSAENARNSLQRQRFYLTGDCFLFFFDSVEVFLVEFDSSWHQTHLRIRLKSAIAKSYSLNGRSVIIPSSYNRKRSADFDTPI